MQKTISLMIALLIAGCASSPRVSEVGTPIPPGVESQLEPGVSTIVEAKALLGPPTSETVTERGTTLGYVHIRTTIQSPYRADSSTDSETLVLFFDEGGLLQKTARNVGQSHMHEP